MRKAYSKDIFRSILKGRRRFFAIMIITVLGVTMFSGLKAACVDLRQSADSFYDGQDLHDICILSTLGLTDDDVAALSSLDGVKRCEGSYETDVQAQPAGSGENVSIAVRSLSPSGMDKPYILEGREPQAAGEAVVTQKFLDDTGLKIGGTFTVLSESETEETGDDEIDTGSDEAPALRISTFTITGSAVDICSIDNLEGSMSYRNMNSENDVAFVMPEAFDSSIYTAVYITLDDTKEMFCYSDEYKDRIADFETLIKNEIMERREKARYDEVVQDASKKIDDAQSDAESELESAKDDIQEGESELKSRLAKSESELAEAKKKIEDGRSELESGEKELDKNESKMNEKFRSAWDEIEKAWNKIDANRAKLESGREKLAEAKKKLAASQKELDSKKQETAKKISAGRASLQSQLSQIRGNESSLDSQTAAARNAFGAAWPADAWDSLVSEARKAYLPVFQAKAAQDAAAAAAAEKSAEAAIADEKSAFTEAVSAAVKSIKDAAVKSARQQAGEKARQEAENAASSESGESVSESASAAAIEAAVKAAQEKAEKETLAGFSQLDELAAQLPLMAVSRGQLLASEDVVNASLTELESQEKAANEQFTAAQAKIDSGLKEITSQESELVSGEKELEDGISKLKKNEAKLESEEKKARAKLESAKDEIEENRAKLDSAESAYESGSEKYESGKAEGESSLESAWNEYHDGEDEARRKIADARAKMSDIEMADWYLQDRMSLSGYSNVSSDADSIEGIAVVFPIVFFVVAILMSLTTITRLVEEDRALIGTYKALGFTDREIRRKYIIYALLSGGLGCILGTICAFVVLPEIIFRIFRVMYLIPSYKLTFEKTYGLLGPVLFAGGIIAATAAACRSELKHNPAVLMRPKAPRAGMRVFIEFITPLWSRLSFLNKMTARNIFRYKKRLFMTISGIAGCMALLMFGFSIKDSVTDLMPRQYEQTYRYDMMAVVAPDDNDTLLSYLQDNADIDKYINLDINSAVIKGSGSSELSVQLIVVPEGGDISPYISLTDLKGKGLSLADGEVYVTRNAGTVMGFSDGDTIKVQLSDLTTADLNVTSMCENYLGNCIYMTQSTYEKYFGDYKPDGVLAVFSEKVSDPIGWGSDFSGRDCILSCITTKELVRDFSTSFALINMVVYIVIFMSACLAFVVLFTLSTTNVSERVRELATIKVLGFYDREVHLYINKETMILTVLGIICGLPLGYFFAQTLSLLLDLPAIYLAPSLHPASYAASAGLSLVFAVLVDLIMNRSLDQIDPIEALKSVE